MNISPKNRASSAGFTLVELLTVIAIIAILMGLLFPAIMIARQQARRTQAKLDVKSVCSSVQSYYSEYGKYPLGANAVAAPTGDFLFDKTSTVSNQQLFDILRNIDSTGQTPPGQPNPYNPKGIVYFDGHNASDQTNPLAGMVAPSSTSGQTVGAFIDPWGSEYRIAVDADYSGQITNLPYNDFSGPTNGPYTGVAAYSLGKDQTLGTNGDGFYKKPGSTTSSDDIITWQ